MLAIQSNSELISTYLYLGSVYHFATLTNRSRGGTNCQVIIQLFLRKAYWTTIRTVCHNISASFFVWQSFIDWKLCKINNVKEFFKPWLQPNRHLIFKLLIKFLSWMFGPTRSTAVLQKGQTFCLALRQSSQVEFPQHGK